MTKGLKILAGLMMIILLVKEGSWVLFTGMWLPEADRLSRSLALAWAISCIGLVAYIWTPLILLCASCLNSVAMLLKYYQVPIENRPPFLEANGLALGAAFLVCLHFVARYMKRNTLPDG